MPTETLIIASVSSPNWYSNGTPIVPTDDLVASFNGNLGEANFGENQSSTVTDVRPAFATPVLFSPASAISNVTINITARGTGANSGLTLPTPMDIYLEIDDQFGSYISSTSFTQNLTGSNPRFGTDFATYSFSYDQTWFTSPEAPQPWNAAWFFPAGGPGTGGIYTQLDCPLTSPAGWPQICLIEAVVTYASAGRIATWVAPAWPPTCGVPPLRHFKPFDLIDRGAVSPEDVTALYAAKFGQPPSGYYLWVVWRALDDDLWPNDQSPIEGYIVP